MEITTNAKLVSDKYRKAGKVLSENWSRYILQLCALQIMYIKARTEKGYDVNGNSLKRNSIAYGKKKLEVVGHTKPLILSGSMLNAMISELVNTKQGRIVFSNNLTNGAAGIYSKMGINPPYPTNKEKAAMHNSYNEFFAGNQEEVDKLGNALLIMIRKDLANVL